MAVICAVGEDQCGFDIQQITRIIRLPGSDRATHPKKGTMGLGGRIVPVLDLERLRERDGENVTGAPCILVLEHGEQKTGVVVDAVLGVIPFDAEALIPLEGFALRSNHRVGFKVLNIGSRMITMIQLEA